MSQSGIELRKYLKAFADAYFPTDSDPTTEDEIFQYCYGDEPLLVVNSTTGEIVELNLKVDDLKNAFHAYNNTEFSDLKD